MKQFLTILAALFLFTATSYGQFQFDTSAPLTFMSIDTVNSTQTQVPSATQFGAWEHSLSSPIPGPLTVISGAGNSSYTVLADFGPPLPNVACLAGGILNLSPATAIPLFTGVFPLNVTGTGCGGGLGAGCGLDLILIDISPLPPGVSFSLQGVVVNGVYPVGYRLTNPIQVTTTP